jgi:ATPase family associated with various cellular activities (AAA)
MNGSENWQELNARYLSAGLLWLRACLESCAGPRQHEPSPLPLAAPPTQSRSIWKHFVQRSAAPAAKMRNLLPASSQFSGNRRVAEAASTMRAVASEMQPSPALLLLAQRLGLSQFEQQVLLLCVGVELDSGIAALCAGCQNDLGRAYPTFALALSIFENPSWDALSPERPLRYWRLVEINQPGGQPLTTSALRADERIVNYIKGLNYLDDRLAPMLTPLEVSSNSADLPASHGQSIDTIINRFKQVEKGQSLPVIQLLGHDTATKQLVASEVASALHLKVCRLSASILPVQAGDLAALARLWQRESLLLPLALYVDASEATTEGSPPGAASAVSRLLEQMEGFVFLDTREVWQTGAKPVLHIDAAKPTSAEQQAAWQQLLGADAGESPARLAGQFNLSLTAIRRVAAEVLSAGSASDPHSVFDRLWQACVAGTRPRLDALAQRLEPKVTWDDLVLPATEQSVLQQIADQVAHRSRVYEAWGFGEKMSRGLGISVLFAGESGTGKTMAAEVIANHLRLNIYRIDLSAVVSKYIGETEKNLRRLFDAAEDGCAILFFDEADALFGKRSEVKDSHDRYANIEINYLLQRMEAYRGLAILATNMKSALDQAFLRRLRFVVNFPFPAVAQRKAIWQKVFPLDLPKDTLDFERLARLNMTGGNIHNIALNAAFLAARAGSPLGMPHILDAARSEFRKLDRPINEMDFRWQAANGGVVA